MTDATKADSTENPIDLNGPKILIQGDSGTGKTYAIGTAVDWAEKHNRRVVCLFTEPGLETLLGYWRDPRSGKPPRPVPKNLAWHVVPGAALGLAALTEAAKNVGMLSYESLTKLTDSSRSENNPAYKMLTALADFPDDRTNTKLGNIGKFGSDTIFVIDSLSETANLYEKMVIGNKPTMAQNEYGVAQTNLMNFLRFMTGGHAEFGLIMTAHLQKQTNEITGAMNLTTKAIGKAMADDVPRLFSEVLYSYREGTSWYWDTSATNVVTKTRYLPIKSKITPDLGQIYDSWLNRMKEG